MRVERCSGRGLASSWQIEHHVQRPGEEELDGARLEFCEAPVTERKSELMREM